MLKKFLVLILIRGTGSGSNIIINLLIARLINTSEAGIVFFSLAISQFAAIAARFGMDTLSLRTMAEMKSLSINKKSATRFLVKTYAIMAVVVVPVIIMALVFAYYSKAGGDYFKITFLMLVICIPCMAFISISSESLKGLGKVNDGLFWQTLCQPIVFLFLILVVSPDFSLVSILMALSYLIAAIGSGFWCKKKIDSSFQNEVERASVSLSEYWKLGFPFFVISITSGVVDMVDTLLLGFLGTSKDVGIYYVSSKIAALSSIILFLVNSYVAPQIAALYSQKKYSSLNAIMKKSQNAMLCVAGGLLVAIVFLGKYVLMLFGWQYAENGFFSLIVLSIGYFFVLAFGPVGIYMSMTGKQHYYMKINSIACGANILINLILIPKYGLNGACFGSATSLALKNLFLYYKFRKFNTDA